jgi:hypothetical protein
MHPLYYIPVLPIANRLSEDTLIESCVAKNASVTHPAQAYSGRAEAASGGAKACSRSACISG